MATGTSRFLRDCFLSSLAYVATTWLAIWLLTHLLADAAPALRALIALLPVFPIVIVVRLLVRRMLAGDELQQRIDLEAIAIAYGFARAWAARRYR